MPKILVFSKDQTLFKQTATSSIGDARKRHIYYTDRLRDRYPNSEIRIVTYTKYKDGGSYDQPNDGFCLYGTRSFHRATYIFGLFRLLPVVFADGWRPDVVTVQTPWEEGVLGLIVARVLGARFLPQLHFDLFSDAWVAEHWLNPWRRLVAKSVLKYADRVRVVSTRLRAQVIGQCHVLCKNVCVAPVGVNFVSAIGNKQHFKKNLQLCLDDRKVVLFVGNLYAPKNLVLWVKVARMVAMRAPKAFFLIVGDGPDKSMILEQVKAADLEDRFLFMGNIGHDSLPEIYAAADVFLLTSHYEGFGRVVLEAMLAGVPVVSTACGGPEDLIEDGYSGFLLTPGNSEGLADRVTDLLENETLATEMGNQAQKQVAEEFNFERLADRIIDFWVTA